MSVKRLISKIKWDYYLKYLQLKFNKCSLDQKNLKEKYLHWFFTRKGGVSKGIYKSLNLERSKITKLIL